MAPGWVVFGPLPGTGRGRGPTHVFMPKRESASGEPARGSFLRFAVGGHFVWAGGDWVAPPMTATLFSAVSDTEVRLSRELMG
eukprot:6254926-Prymnesium_polylepis.3